MTVGLTGAVSCTALYKLQEAKDQQGFTGKIIDFAKSLFDCGSTKLDEQLVQLETGELDEETFLKHVEEYEAGQKNLTNGLGTTAAIIAGAAAGSLVLASAPFSLPLLLAAVGIGAAAGAISKFGISFIGDEATNNIKGDATISQGLKEAASGALYGGISALMEYFTSKIAASALARKVDPRHLRVGHKIMTKISSHLSGIMLSGTFNAIFEPITNKLIYGSDDSFIETVKQQGPEEFFQELIPVFGELIDIDTSCQ